MTPKARPLGVFLIALTGPTLWAVHFFVIYGAEAAVCTRASSPTYAMQWIVISATGVALAAIAALLLWEFRNKRANTSDALRLLSSISISLAALSAGAILAVAVSALRLPACMSPAG